MNLMDFYALDAVRKSAFLCLGRHFDCTRLEKTLQSLTDHPETCRQLMIQFAKQHSIDVSKFLMFQRRTECTTTEVLAMPAILARCVHEASQERVHVRGAEYDETEDGLGAKLIVIISSSAGRDDNDSRRSRRVSRQGTPRRFHRAARFAGAR